MTDTEFRVALIQLGMSRKQFADRIGRDMGTISRWAAGSHPIPRVVDVVVELLRYKAAMNGASNPEAT
jgi:transcriptional regulator with XRE-family HTH domain